MEYDRNFFLDLFLNKILTPDYAVNYKYFLPVIMSLCCSIVFYVYSTLSPIFLSSLTVPAYANSHLKVVNQKYPDILAPDFYEFEDSRPGYIGSLDKGNHLVYNNNYVFAYLHNGPWHLNSVKLGRKLQEKFFNRSSNSTASRFIRENDVKMIAVNCNYRMGECVTSGFAPEILPAIYFYVSSMHHPYVYNGDFSLSDIEKFMISVVDPTSLHEDLVDKFDSLPYLTTYKINFITTKDKLSPQQYDIILSMANYFHSYKTVSFNIRTDKKYTNNCHISIEKRHQIANDKKQITTFTSNDEIFTRTTQKHFDRRNDCFEFILNILGKTLKDDHRIIYEDTVDMGGLHTLNNGHLNVTLTVENFKDDKVSLVLKARLEEFYKHALTESSPNLHVYMYKNFENPTFTTCVYKNNYGQIHDYDNEDNTISQKHSTTKKKIQIKSIGEEEKLLKETNFIEKRQRFGFVKNNSTIVNIKILTNMSEILVQKHSNYHENLKIIWIHKRGHGISSSIFGPIMMKLTQLLVRYANTSTHNHCTTEILEIVKFVHLNDGHSNGYNPGQNRQTLINLIPDKVPAIVLFEQISGRSVVLDQNGFLKFDYLLEEIWKFLERNNFGKLLSCWDGFLGEI